MSEYRLITVTDAYDKLKQNSAQLVDIRDPVSFNAAHVKGAFHLIDNSLLPFMHSTDFATPVMVLCYHGHSSRGAAQYLVNQGFDEVYSVEGGFERWQANYPESLA